MSKMLTARIDDVLFDLLEARRKEKSIDRSEAVTEALRGWLSPVADVDGPSAAVSPVPLPVIANGENEENKDRPEVGVAQLDRAEPSKFQDAGSSPAANSITPGAQQDSEDVLYPQAVAIIRETGKLSCAELQRRLKISYGTAAHLIERARDEKVLEEPKLEPVAPPKPFTPDLASVQAELARRRTIILRPCPECHALSGTHFRGCKRA